MEQIAFTMQLRAGCAAEYQRRHDALWPELAGLLHDAGIRDYSIFLDPASGKLFAVLRRLPTHGMDALPDHPVMQRWWEHMSDLMDTDAQHRPQSQALLPMFHLS